MKKPRRTNHQADGLPTNDMPEATGEGAVRGRYAGLVARDAPVFVYDTEAGIPPEKGTAKPLKRRRAAA